MGLLTLGHLPGLFEFPLSDFQLLGENVLADSFDELLARADHLAGLHQNLLHAIAHDPGDVDHPFARLDASQGGDGISMRRMRSFAGGLGDRLFVAARQRECQQTGQPGGDGARWGLCPTETSQCLVSDDWGGAEIIVLVSYRRSSESSSLAVNRIG